MDKIDRNYDYDLDDVIDKLDEIVKGYNEGEEQIVKRWDEQIKINSRLTEYCDRILKRLDNIKEQS